MKNFKIKNTKQLRSVNFHNTSEIQLNIGIGDQTRNQNVEANYWQYSLNSHKTLIESLRGGGCGTSIVKPIEDKISEKINLPYEFIDKLKGNCDLLVSKGQMLLGEQSSTNSIFIALQWFHYNSEYINVCCQSKVYVKQVYELFICNAQKLLEVLPNYIRSSGFLAYRLLLILNDLFRVVFSFQIKEKKRLLDETKKQQLISLVENARSEFEIESTQVWKTGIDYELSLIEIMLHNCNINYSEGKELFTSFIYNLAKSVCSMSIEDDLIKNIIESGKYLLNAVYEKVSFPKEVYFSYYYFQTLKWRIISEIKNNQNVKKQIDQLVLGYQTYVEKSDDWIIHYCWVQLVCDLLSYRAVIFKDAFLSKLKSSERQEKWNSLAEKNLLKPLPQQNQGVIQLYTNYQFIDSNLKTILNNECKIRSFELLCDALMFEKFNQEYDFWSIYTNFQFKKSKAKKNQNESQLLFTKLQGIDQLQNLNDLLILSFNSIQKLVNTIQKLIDNISIPRSKRNQEIYTQELETNTTKLLSETIKSLYILSEVAGKSNLIFIQLELIDEQSKKQGVKDPDLFEKIKKSKTELDQQLKSLIRNIQSQQIICLKIELLEQNLSDIQNLNDNQFISEFSGFSEVIEKIDIFIVQQKAMSQNLIRYFMDANSKAKSDKIYLMEILMEKKEFLNKLQSLFPQIIIEMYGGENLQDLQQNKISSKKEISDLQLETKKRITFFEIVKQFQRIMLWKSQYIVDQLEIFKNSNADSEKDNSIIVITKTLVSMLESQKKLLAQRFSQELRENQISQIVEEFSQNLLQNVNIFNSIQVKEEEKKIKNKAINLIVQLKQQIIKFGKDPSKTLLDFQLLNEIIEQNLVDWSQIEQMAEQSEVNQKVTQYEMNEKIQKQTQTFEKQIKHMIVELNKILVFLKIDEAGVKTQDQYDSNTENSLENEYYQQLNALTTLFKEQINNRKQMIENYFLKEQQNPDQKITEEQILYVFNENYQGMPTTQFYVDQQFLEILDSTNQQKLNQKQNSQQGNDYKVRECMIVNLIKIQACVSEDQPQQFVQKWIKQIWIIEKDENVRNLLKNKDILEMQKKLFSQNLKSFSSQIQCELQEKLNELQILEQQLSLEGNEDMRKQIQKQINLAYQEIDQYIDNITDMSQQMNINLVFLKEITKELKSIKSKIDLLQQNLNSIAVDLRKLRGKQYNELLQIRKKKVLWQARQNELDSVYIPLKTYEYDAKTGLKVKTPKGNEISLLLMESYVQNTSEKLEGEVNEFISDDTNSDDTTKIQKDVLLLRGLAGSGKSRSAKKIEEFLWKINGHDSNWVPIFISLPSIKSPKFNLIDQALDSDYYNFDSTQIKEFKEAIILNNERVIFILDSYDEMKQDCIQSNLILTNGLIQEFNIQNNPGKYIKFIITTRSEILNPLGFRNWFYGSSLETLKDVELIKFDENQIQDYLKKYVELSVKRKIKSLYEFIKQLRGQELDPEEFQKIWQTIEEIVQECNEQEISNSVFIFQNKEEDKILSILKSHAVFRFIKDQQIITLRKDLLSLWNSKMFQISIQNVNIEQLLTTPFMLEIVVQVLPQMINQESNSIEFKERFTKNFNTIYKNYFKSNKLIASYQANEKIKNKKDDYQQIQKKQIKQDQLNQEVKEIIDQLEKQKFFANYQLTDKILVYEEFIQINENRYPVGKAVDLIVAALQMKKITIYQFYECFIQLYHEQQIQKLRQLGKISNYESFQIDVLKFSQSLALDLTINQQTQVRYTQKGKIKFQSQYEKYQKNAEWEEQYFNDSGENSEYLKQIRSCALLITKSAAFSFTHKSIQEFLVAKYIFDLIHHIKFNSDQAISQQDKENLLHSIYNQDKFNLSNENYLGVISLLKYQLEVEDEIDQKLIHLVKFSQEKKFIRSASNSIYLLSNRGTFLGGMQFSNIQLQDTNLYGLSFFGSDLSGAQFSNVTIDACNFNFCNVYNSSWKGIICKEKPYLKGHAQTVKIVTFSKDGKLLATCESHQIIIWDISTFKEVTRIKEFSAEILCVKFFENYKLITGGIDKILRLWCQEQAQNYDLKLQLEDHQHPIVKILLSNDEKQIYTLDKGGLVIIWDVDNLFEKPFLIGEEDSNITEIIFTSNEEYFFAIDKGLSRISYYKLKNRTCITHISTNDKQFIKLALSSNDHYLASYDEEKTLLVWDVSIVSNFKLIYYEENVQDIQDIAFSPDNLYLTSIGENVILDREISKMNGAIIQTKLCNCKTLSISDFNNLFGVSINQEILIFDLYTNQIINSIDIQNAIEVDKITFSTKSSEMAIKIQNQQRKSIIFWNLNNFQKEEEIIDTYNYDIEIFYSQQKKIVLVTNHKNIIITNIKDFYKLKPQPQNFIQGKHVIVKSQNIKILNYEGTSWHIQELYENQDVKQNQELQFEAHVSFFSLSSSDQYLLFGLQNGQILVMKDLSKKPELFLQLKCYIFNLALSFNHQLLAAVEYNQKLNQYDLSIWDFESKQNTLYINKFILDTKICFYHDNKFLVFARERDIIFFDCFSKDEQIKQSHEYDIQDFSFQHERNLIASIDCASIIIQNLVTFKIIKSSSVMLSYLKLITFWNSETILTSCKEFVQIWKIHKEEKIILEANIAVRSDDVFQLQCLQNRLQLGVKNTLGLEIYNFNMPNIFYCAAINSPIIEISNGQQLVAIGDQSIELIQIQGQLKLIELNNEARTRALTFSNDDQLLVSYGDDHTIKIWNLKTQKILGRIFLISLINKISFFDDNARLICEGSNIITLDVMSNSVILTDVYTAKQKIKTEKFDQLCSIKTNKIVSQNYEFDWIFRNWSDDLHQNFLLQETYNFEKISYYKEKFLILKSETDLLQILNFDEKKVLRSFKDVDAYDISFDEKCIAIINSDMVKIIDIESNKNLSHPFGYNNFYKVKMLKFASLDILICAFDLKLKVYQVVQNKIICVKEIINNQNIVFLRALPLIKLIVVNSNNKVRFINFQKLQTKTLLFNSSESEYVLSKLDFLDMAKRFDEKQLVVLQQDSEQVIVWDLERLTKLKEFSNLHSDQILFLQSNDFVMLDRDQIKQCNFQDYFKGNGLQPTIIGASAKQIRCISQLPGTSLLASGGDDQKVVIWDINGRSQIAVFQGHSKSIHSLDYSTNCNLITSGGEDAIIRLWNLNGINSYEVHEEGHTLQISCLRFSLDGLQMVSSGYDCKIRLWNTCLKQTFNIYEEQKDIITIFELFKKNNQDLLINCSINGEVRIKSITNKNNTTTIVKNISLPISQVIFKGDEMITVQTFQVTDKKQSFLNFWNLNKLLHTQQTNQIINGIGDFSFSPNSQKLAYTDGKEKQLIMLDVQNKKSQCLQTSGYPLNLITFSKDGKKIAAITFEFVILIWHQQIDQIWTLQEAKNLQMFFQIEEKLLSLSFSLYDNFINIITKDFYLSYNSSNSIIINDKDVLNQQQACIYLIRGKHNRNFIAIYCKDNENKSEDEQYFISLYSLEEKFQKNQQLNVSCYWHNLCFSANCEYIAAHTYLDFIVWDVKTGNPIFGPQRESNPIQLISFYKNDGIISHTRVDTDYGISYYYCSFWKFGDRFCVKLSIDDSIEKISESGTYLITYCPIRLHTIDPINKKFETWIIDEKYGHISASFSEKEDFLAIMKTDKSILILDLKNRIIKSSIKSNVYGFINDFANSQILIITPNNELFLFTLDSNFEISQKNFYNPLQNIQHASITNDGQILTIQEQKLVIIQQEKFKALNRCYFENGIDQAVIHPNGILYAKEENKIKLYNVEQNKKVEEIDSKEETNIYLSPNDQYFIITEQGKIFFVQVEKIKEYSQAISFEAHYHAIKHVAISRDQTLLVTMCQESFIKIWNISDQSKPNLKVVFRDQACEIVKKFEFSYDSTFLARMFEEQILIIDINDCQQPESQKIFDFRIYGMANYKQQNDKETLLFVAKKQLFYFNENLEKEEILINFSEEAQQFAFTYDAFSFALVGKEGTLSMYHIHDLKSDIKLSIQVKSKIEFFNCLTFSFDGQFLLTGGSDRSIRLWDSKDLKQVAFLEDLSNSVTAVAFSPDGIHFSAGFFDGSVGLYITNALKSSVKVKKKCKCLLQSLGESPQMGCLKLFSQHSLLQAQKCRFQDRLKQESDDKSLEALFAQKAQFD